jgi:hypothetical protein
VGSQGPGSPYRGLRPSMYPEKPKRCSTPLDNTGSHLLSGCRWTRGWGFYLRCSFPQPFFSLLPMAPALSFELIWLITRYGSSRAAHLKVLFWEKPCLPKFWARVPWLLLGALLTCCVRHGWAGVPKYPLMRLLLGALAFPTGGGGRVVFPCFPPSPLLL